MKKGRTFWDFASENPDVIVIVIFIIAVSLIMILTETC